MLVHRLLLDSEQGGSTKLDLSATRWAKLDALATQFPSICAERVLKTVPVSSKVSKVSKVGRLGNSVRVVSCAECSLTTVLVSSKEGEV